MNLENVITAADTTRMDAGGESMFSQLTNAFTYGAASAAISGLTSLYNTGIWYKNKLTGSDTEETEAADIIDGLSQNMGAYYQQHKGAIDTVGFIGGAFIPGGAALKGLQLMRSGKAVGAFGRVAGFTSVQQERYLAAGLKELAQEGPSVFSTINQNKMLSMAYGAADNVLQTAVFETAVALTMHQSPTLKDESWEDIAYDIVKTSLVGGALGGGIEALFVNKIFRDATKSVDQALRKVDSIQALEKMGLTFGDETFSVMDSILNLPKQALEVEIPFKYSLNGKSFTQDLDFSKLANRKLEDTVKNALIKVEAKLANVVAGDTSVGVPLARAMLDIRQAGINAGKTDAQIREELGNVLHNLKRVEGIGSENEAFGKEVFYFIPGARFDTLEGVASAVTTTKPGTKAPGYALHGSFADLRGGVLGVDNVPGTLADAWRAGFDVVIDPAHKTLQVNPSSQLLRRISDNPNDDLVRLVYNPRTNTTSESGLANVADVANSIVPLKITPTGVQSGKYTFVFNHRNFDPAADSVKATARSAWAAEQKNFNDVVVDARDFALLDRLKQGDITFNEGTMIRLPEGVEVSFKEMPDFAGWLTEQKVLAAKEMFEPRIGGFVDDARLVAYRLNTEFPWVQEVVSTNFDVAKMLKSDNTFRPLASLQERDNLVLSYDKIAMDRAEKFPTGMLAYHQRVQEAKRKTQEAAASVLKDDYALLPDISAAGLKADSTGTGPSFLGSSNADYSDPLRATMQAAGQAVSQIRQKFRNIALEEVQPAAAKLLTTPTPELGAVLTAIRRTDRSVALMGAPGSWKVVDLAYLKSLADPKGKPLEPAIELSIGDDVADFLQAYDAGHKRWFDNKSVLAAAQGVPLKIERDALYMPPIDTRHVPYFAFVRNQEGAMFSTSEVSMVTARTQGELLELTNQIKRDHPSLDVIFKDDTAKYHKAKGDYDFSAGMNGPNIDPYLRKKGVLGDFMPTLEPKAVIEEFVTFIGRREDALVRAATSTKYAQEFAELRWLSEQYSKVATSKFAFIGKLTGKTIEDPFGDYIRLATDVSKKAEFTFWHSANEFVDAVGTRAYQAVERAFGEAKKGDITWEEANKAMEKMNLTGPFTSQESYLRAQIGGEGNLIKSAVYKGNMLLATIGLRLDMANAIVNTISSPLMLGAEISSIRNSLKSNPELLAAFESTMAVKSPDGLVVPSTIKLLGNAIHNFFSAGKEARLERYKAIGAIKDVNSQYHDMLSDLAMTPNLVPGKWAKRVDAAVEKGATITGNNWAEDFTRYVAADTMRQITDPLLQAGKMSLKEQDAFIRIFVNRTQGNYTASQRPIAFQGTIGAAISLFQTFQFNLFQQLFRHIENRDAKTIAVMGGLQTALFGLNGLPMFDAINTHLVGMASINEGHHDVYSKMVGLVGKDIGDWALYGTASAFPLFSDKWPSLYTRGDLNPRSLTLVPTSFNEVPIVSVATRFASAVAGFGNQVANGAPIGAAFLQGLEHNGISRPLAGIAQVMQGQSTTSKGSIIAANSDWLSIASATRVLGAKPMDESVALNHMFRLNAYKAYDLDRQEKLGAVVKSKIRSGDLTPEDVVDFGAEYAARGGRIEGYSQAMQRWMRSTQQSEVNKVMQAHSSERGQRLLEVMGADPLPDFANQPPAEE